MSARLARTQALGPAIGTTGAGLSGPGVVIATVAPGKWLGTVSARLRTRVLSASVSLGSVLVQVALIDARSAASASDLADSIDDVAAVWAGARYVSTGRGAVWHPNVYASEEMAVVARVWNRDDLDSSSRTVASVLNEDQGRKVGWVRHPLVRPHPVTGRRALYAVSGSSFGVEGMPSEESRALLDELKRHATQDKHQLRLKYGVGDLVIWDNASLLHSATLTDPEDPRTLWRITVKEERTS